MESGKKEERRELANNLSAAINPLLKNLNDPSSLVIPHLFSNSLNLLYDVLSSSIHSHSIAFSTIAMVLLH